MRLSFPRLSSPRLLWFDELGLRRGVADPALPFQVAAMAFLASLALGGWTGAAVLAGHWDGGAGSALTVQVPQPMEPDASASATRLTTVMGRLSAAPGVESAKALTNDELNTLLRPWLGTDMKNLTVQIPAVISVHLSRASADLGALSAELAASAPGTVLEDHDGWAGRLGTLSSGLRWCAGVVLISVMLAAAAVIAAATWSGLAGRRDAIGIIHQLGATDGYIARRFAIRAATLASAGGAIGGSFALPVLFTLAALAAPLAGGGASAGGFTGAVTMLPLALWLLPLILPVAAALIGFATAQVTMLRWLRRLP